MKKRGKEVDRQRGSEMGGEKEKEEKGSDGVRKEEREREKQRKREGGRQREKREIEKEENGSDGVRGGIISIRREQARTNSKYDKCEWVFTCVLHIWRYILVFLGKVVF